MNDVLLDVLIGICFIGAIYSFVCFVCDVFTGIFGCEESEEE